MLFKPVLFDSVPMRIRRLVSETPVDPALHNLFLTASRLPINITTMKGEHLIAVKMEISYLFLNDLPSAH